MTMNETLWWVISFGVGGGLGGFFFWGLWWTIQKGLEAKNPALIFVSSLLVRSSVVLVGFYVISDGHWERLLACILGFTLARFVVKRVVQNPSEVPNAS